MLHYFHITPGLDAVFVVVQELNPENLTELGQRLELQKAQIGRTSLCTSVYIHRVLQSYLSVSALCYVELILPLTLLCCLCSSCFPSLCCLLASNWCCGSCWKLLILARIP